MSEVFLLRYFLSRFLALFNINNETIDDETFKDVNDNETFKSDDEIIKILRDRRTRVR